MTTLTLKVCILSVSNPVRVILAIKRQEAKSQNRVSSKEAAGGMGRSRTRHEVPRNKTAQKTH